jgi:hypothetical protein
VWKSHCVYKFHSGGFKSHFAQMTLLCVVITLISYENVSFSHVSVSVFDKEFITVREYYLITNIMTGFFDALPIGTLRFDIFFINFREFQSNSKLQNFKRNFSLQVFRMTSMTSDLKRTFWQGVCKWDCRIKTALLDCIDQFSRFFQKVLTIF